MYFILSQLDDHFEATLSTLNTLSSHKDWLHENTTLMVFSYK